MKLTTEHFEHCPRCGAALDEEVKEFRLHCAQCGFVLYFNPAVSVVAFLSRPDGMMLFIRRAKDPGQGKLATPGGFIDVGEAAEQALERETREEVGLSVRAFSYLISRTNTYDYREVRYPVLDLFFTATVPQDCRPQALDDVAAVAWLPPESVDLEQIAFPSVRWALEHFIQTSLPNDR